MTDKLIWLSLPFTDVFSDVSKLGKKLLTTEYLDKGKYPIVDQGQSTIAGYTNLEDGLYSDVPAIIFGDHTRIIKYIDQPFFLGADGVKLLKSKLDNVDYKYLYYFLKHLHILDTGYNRHFKYLKEQTIIIPPLAEQKHIATVLDKAAELIALKKQQLAKMDQLVKARFVEVFGDPMVNPMGWDVKNLSEECDVMTGNTPPRSDQTNYGEYIEWIKSDNINTPNMYLTQASEMLSEKGLAIGRYVDAGSILMTCIAGSISCIGNVALTNKKVSYNQQINAILPKENNPYFLYYLFLLSKPIIQSTVNMSLKGILSKGKLLELTFPFPPISLQNEFADFVEQTEIQKSLMQESLSELEKNYLALMQQYFG